MLKELLLHPTVCSRAQSSLVIWLAGRASVPTSPPSHSGSRPGETTMKRPGGVGGWWDTGVNSDRTEEEQERGEERSC